MCPYRLSTSKQKQRRFHQMINKRHLSYIVNNRVLRIPPCRSSGNWSKAYLCSIPHYGKGEMHNVEELKQQASLLESNVTSHLQCSL